jgi:hypothetical protein
MLHPAPEPAKVTKFNPHQSSLFPSEVDSSVNKLAESIKWYLNIGAMKSERLSQCLEIFRKENLGFEIIKNLSNGLFNK